MCMATLLDANRAFEEIGKYWMERNMKTNASKFSIFSATLSSDLQKSACCERNKILASSRTEGGLVPIECD